MATRLYFSDQQTNGYHSITRDWSNTTTALTQLAATTIAAGGAETQLNAKPSGSEAAEFITWRVIDSVTISGTITLRLFINESVATVNATPRAKFWRLTAGGSDIEDYLGQIDGTAELGTITNTAVTITGTLPSFIFSPNERLIVRLYAIPFGGSFGAGSVTLGYNGTVGTLNDSYIEFTEAIDFMGVGSLLYLRDSTANGISGFRDLLATKGSATATGVVTTVASGSDIQWTKTAGGAALAWISRRLVQPATFTAASGYPKLQYMASESGNSVNAQVRVRVWKRDLGGTETLLWGPYDRGAELTTSIGATQISQGVPVGTPGLTATLDVNDRIVVRVYANNSGTMGNGTATLQYDGASPSTNMATFAIGAEGLIFKAESEPDNPVIVPGGLATTGVGQ